MKIERIEAIPFRIPLNSKVSFASGQLTSLDHVLVRVHGAGGIVGTAEAPARSMVYGESTASIVHAVLEWFAPAIAGLDARDIAARGEWQKRIEHNATARGAVDIACHDLVARALGMPLRHMLGGFADEVRVSHILGIGDPGAIADDAQELRQRHGITAFKLKAGLDPARDTALIREIRKRLGDDVSLSVDCNHGYDPQTAARTIASWEDYGIGWVEEPCPGETEWGPAWVAAHTAIPLMADESAVTPQQVHEKLASGTYRFICLKTARNGYALNRQILALCETIGAGAVIGSQGDTDLGTLTSAQFAAAHGATRRHPAELTFYLEAEGGLLVEKPQIVDGKLRLPDGPGHGGAIEEELLDRWRIDR